MCAKAAKVNYMMHRVMSRINLIWYWSYSHREFHDQNNG